MTSRHFIYELWIGDELLYVGCSPRPKSRYNHHCRGWSFMRQVEVRTVAEYPDRDSALLAEAERIRELAPPFNIVWHPTCDGTAKGRRERKAVVREDKLRRESAYWQAVMERNRIIMDAANRELEEAEKAAREGA